MPDRLEPVDLSRVPELLAANRLPEAETACRHVLSADPDHPAALHYLGIVATRTGHQQAAVDLIARAIALRSAVAEYHYNLAQPLLALGRLADAERALGQALRLAPDLMPARWNLGAVLGQQGRWAEAEAEYRAALALRPDPAVYVNLGRVCRWQERPDEAIDCYRRAIELAPGFAGAYAALGSVLREVGRATEAVAAFRRAVDLDPRAREAHSNLLYALQFDPEVAPAENLAEHRRWAARFADPLRSETRPHANNRDANRRLRVGYVSPDWMHHPVGWFMEPILEHHDRTQIEVVCYAGGPRQDDLTDRLRAHADVWRPTHGATDEQLAQLVRDDGIDVLVDLAQHMRGSRLTVFARKPAPVQITHLAYCATSGLNAMDWCVTDPLMSPPGVGDEAWFTERLLRLDGCYWCYRPSTTGPAVGPLPARERGFVTFGSLNTLAKVNPRVIALWARVLAAVPGSRLAVSAPMGDANTAVRDAFAAGGVDPARLTLVPRAPRDGYLAAYNTIDIALDPFPYAGGTTSLDALWMGVPLVTLAGQRPLGRTGVTLLTHLGLPELIAPTPDDYVRIAADLAADVDRLERLRTNLRARLAASPLMDAPRYARSLEAAYRDAWRQWCAS